MISYSINVPIYIQSFIIGFYILFIIVLIHLVYREDFDSLHITF